MSINLRPVRIQQISDPLIKPYGVKIFMLRLDQNHLHISGNKWYKLKYNLEQAQKDQKDTILTFGGAYSNHIAATAAAGKELGIKTIGIIRGEESDNLNKTISFAKKCGMEIQYVSREEYRKKNEPAFLSELNKKFGDFYLVPEGGHNYLGLKGCKEILNEYPFDFDYVCCSCGTGTTLAGLILSLKQHQQAIGFVSLKGGDFLENNIRELILQHTGKELFGWSINHDYHFGRYAKRTDELNNFIERFEEVNHIPLEHVYTGKMMFGIYDLIKKGKFTAGETILSVHTGGLQGRS